jgi:hypothetical protein
MRARPAAPLFLMALLLAGCGGGDGDGIRASGQVEATEVRVASKVPGNIERVAVEEGTWWQRAACSRCSTPSISRWCAAKRRRPRPGAREPGAAHGRQPRGHRRRARVVASARPT